MNTIKQFIEHSHIDSTLIRAVIRQAGGWESFQEMAQDVVDHGAAGGFNGFIYYTDTTEFAVRNQKAIMDLLKELANEFGQSVYALIGGFRCIQLSQDDVIEALHGRSSDRTAVLNGLAWFALEEVCRSYVDLIDSRLAA